MKTGTIKKDKVNIITLGCSKNLVDSENILTQLRANEIDAHHQLETKKKIEQPNVIIINTCGFIEKAKEESISTILDYSAAKSRGEIDKLYVMGCLSHRYKDELSSEIGEVDDWFGTLDMPLILNRFNVDYKHELLGQRLTTTSQHYAYLKISEGCDRACSFCAIPLMRGKHVSRPMEELVQEAKNLAARGTKEIMLIAQELTYYGIDIYRKRVLPELLEKLADIEGVEWIRLHYAYPTGFPLEIIDAMKAHDKICNYLDIPLQSGSNKVLKAMRRGIKREKTEELIDSIRQKLPEIAIRTTLIAGHPHEEQEDHEETLDFVEKMRFDRLGVFSYSHEEDTHSHSMPDTLTEEEKQERVAEIMEIQQGISLELNQEKIGKIYKTLIDRKEGNYFIGRTEFDSPEVDNEVLVDARKTYLRIGDFANVKIDKAEEFDLFGEVVK
ncbi:SSU ribosomal protein S12P methylthiotransferase [Bernardetia litoralis DSM 6794]|uniref:Ribosomal protein uS12 methylthiotransferase RimO n=1 Tax=Bernardetia litoralis (strain ATCC 23117 / DSM 6794 / NBRC 15988 / NCIMB 1366 / Fx l1 / Sio-4) TaxID=880071 RepID=I4AIY2_BERLS|nr:30S ribosomal protein S12 methylthiotransferase RimO [Bernardetia litoralis]AFM03917.1 SSU ribosomal protein S12P methylthiotransferase [Bernardetia litoralis DSM 6794]